MKRIFILLLVLFIKQVNSQTIWTGLGTTNNWNDALNWSTLAVPGTTATTGEDIVFDGTSVKNCIVDIDIDVNTLTVGPGYSGTIDFQSSLPVINSDYSQSSGVVIATTDEFIIGGNFAFSGGTFTHNNGKVSLFVTNGTTTFITGTITFNELSINPTGLPSTQRNLNFGSGCTTSTLTLEPTNRVFGYQGTINILNTLSINGANSNMPAGNTGTFKLNGSSAFITSSAGVGQSKLGNILINTTGTFSMSGNIAVTSSWTNSNVATFNPNSSTVTFYNATINSGTTAVATAPFDNISVATSSALTISGTSRINVFGNITNGGTINCNNSRIALSGNLTNNGTYNASTSLLNLNGTGAQSIGGTSTLTTLRALEISSSGTKSLTHPVNILDSLKLSGSGNLSTGGNLTLKSTTALKGRIAEITSGGTISGNVTVETFAPGGSTGWALLGVGGVSSMTMNDWYDDFPMAIEGSTTGVTSAGGYFESVQGWNEGDAYGYDTTITVNTALTPGTGFWTYLGTGISTTSDIIIDVTGSPVTGAVPISLSNSAQTGTNLIANPYASPISWTALRNGNSAVTNAIYIYNADGPYASFVNGVGTNGGSNIIPAGQGFYVEVLSNTSLTAQESNKRSNNTGANPLLKLNSQANIGLPIRLKINGSAGDYDETVVRFHGAATNAYDIEWDARKIFQTPGYVGYPGGYTKYTTISTKNGNADYSINSLPYALTQNAVIPVVAKVMTSGQYTITGEDMHLLPPNACVTLKDKLLNVTHNIKASPYVCSINDTTSAARFELTVCADVTTGVNENAVVTLDQSVLVKNNQGGIYVDLNFAEMTKANISVTNILGQKIVENKKVTTQNETVHFGLEPKNQLLFVTVETENNKITKKIIH